MKTKLQTLINLLLIFTLLGVLTGCKSNPEETDPTLQMLTSGTWKGATIEIDGEDKSLLFTGFQLTFTATAFTSVNGLGIWPGQGTWSFTNDTKSSITRSDGAVIAISSISESELVLSFTWNPSFSGGRIKSVAGDYIFRLVR